MVKVRISDFVTYTCYDLIGGERVLIREARGPGSSSNSIPVWKVVVETEDGDEEHYVAEEVRKKLLDDLKSKTKGKPYEEELLEEIEHEVKI